MSTTPPISDPITATDPRVAKILAMIQAKNPAPPIAVTPSDPSTQQIAPVAAPVLPQQLGGQSLQQQAAPDIGPPPAQQPVQLPQQSPQLPAPASPDVTQQSGPGPVKSFLMSLGAHLASGVHGGQDALLHSAGLPTSYEKQQNAAHLGIAQQAADDTSAYRQAQTGELQAKADKLDRLQTPFTPDANDQSVLAQFRGKPTTVGQYQNLQGITAAIQGKQGVADTKADASRDVATLQANSKTALGSAMLGYHQAMADRNYDLANQRLGIARAHLGLLNAGLGLREQTVNAALYGLDNKGNPLPGSAQISDDNGGTTTVGARFAPAAIKQQKTVGTFNDLTGSVKNLQNAIQQYQKEGGDLTSPALTAAASDPTSTIGKVINGKMVTGSLTPTEITLLNAQRQTMEQAGILRSTTGGTASEAGAQRILATVPQFGQDTNASALSKIAEQQQVLGRLAGAQTGVRGGVTVHAAPAPAPARPAGIPTNAVWNAQGNNGHGSWRLP